MFRRTFVLLIAMLPTLRLNKSAKCTCHRPICGCGGYRLRLASLCGRWQRVAVFVLALSFSSVASAQDNRVDPIELQPPQVFVRYYDLKMDNGSVNRVSCIWQPTWDEVRRGQKFMGVSAWPWSYSIPNPVPKYNPAFPNHRHYEPANQQSPPLLKAPLSPRNPYPNRPLSPVNPYKPKLKSYSYFKEHKRRSTTPSLAPLIQMSR